jgi:hypothetical protein
VEAVFDEGYITANGSSLPVAEMELELKSGDVQALYQLALDLLGSVPLALETASKAERGFRLLTGNAPEASKAAPSRIDGHASAEEAFKRIVGATLTHLLSNVGAAERGDVEGVHQIRVAVRRLRAALALFKQHLNPTTLGHFNDGLRRLGSLFGGARDWDVFVLETLSAAETHIPEPTLLDPVRKAAEGQRLAAHQALCIELSAASFARLMIGIAASIADGASDLQRKEDNFLKVPIAALRPICSIGWREKWPSEAGIWTRRPVSNCTPYGRLSRNCATASSSYLRCTHARRSKCIYAHASPCRNCLARSTTLPQHSPYQHSSQTAKKRAIMYQNPGASFNQQIPLGAEQL